MSSASVPQTDNQLNSLPPVRTVSGAVLWRVRVNPGERTCYLPYIARRVCETRCGWQGGVYRCSRVCYTVCVMSWP